MNAKSMNKIALASRMLIAPLFAVAASAPAFAVATAAGPIASATAAHPKAQSPAGDEVWSALDKSAWIVEGNPKATQVVYIFTDTECKYCRQLWHDMQPYLAKGKLQSRHVMVAVISDDSAGRGAAVMDSAHPAAALKDNENSKLPRLAPELAIPRSTLKDLDDNAQLMHRLGAQGTPVIVYQDDTGKSIVLQGIPPAEMLAKIFGPAKAK
jgi:thiol:disulfide interchange protein DsbG